MAKYYKVIVNFNGYIGCDEVYNVYADDEDDAINEAREMAMDDLYCTVEECDDEEDD